MTRKYGIKEAFWTIQGEGFHAGTVAGFLRFSGCNMWSGHEEDRVRDARRTGAECPRWCDTDFANGMIMSVEQVIAFVADRWSKEPPLIVLTGGEPMLQVDDELLHALVAKYPHATIAIETNGTVAPKFTPSVWLDTDMVWITMSPKLHPDSTKLLPQWVDELKLVWPAHDPRDWEDFGVDRRYIQPQALASRRDSATERNAAKWIMYNKGWRLSLQQHKIVEVE